MARTWWSRTGSSTKSSENGRAAGQGQPARPVRRPRRAALAPGPGRALDQRRGPGRIETRTIQVTDAPGDLPFPHVSQAYVIERHITATDGTPLSDVAALGVTSLDATRASPQTIASLARGQRAIESLHWLRDTLYREGQSQVRTRSGPQAMAALRNLTVGALHLAGRHDTTDASRWASRHMDWPFTIIAALLDPQGRGRCRGSGATWASRTSACARCTGGWPWWPSGGGPS